VAVAAHANAEGYTVADLGISRLRLATNQALPGYCVLICTQHVREPYDLSREEQRLFFADMLRAGKAVAQAFDPIKLNFELEGNAVPHLHCHIKPRYYGDAAPWMPFPLHEHQRLLAPQEYEERVGVIRAALAALERDERASAEPSS
jgi:diadenosine tetraphosphate (Ap4A) HIT family hydrolase